jgi:cytochrome b6-f complex iron-sulfur subunit
MDDVWALVIALAVVAGLAVAALVAEGRRRAGVGQLGRDTIRRDRSTRRVLSRTAAGSPRTRSELARRRADAVRAALEEHERTGELERLGSHVPPQRAEVSDEEIGITRRQFFNRGVLAGLGLFVAGVGAAMLGFLWPSSAGGFGATITVGTEDDVKQAVDKKQPFYNAGARTYIQPYLSEDLSRARAVYDPRIVAGMEKGYVALYQKCPHLGCRVPWCETSQWFECPCHGSKYNRVGEKKGGPAPRGMDRFVLKVSGGNITVDTSQSSLVLGPPIGTDTTGQTAEGPPCV